ncbi:unnamed protein product [Alopecurus aequalis]
MMLMHKSRYVLSRLLQLGSKRHSQLPLKPTILLRRLFFSDAGEIIKRRLPPLGSRRLSTHQEVSTQWRDWQIVTATALASGCAYAAARIRYGETEPFAGRTYLALLSRKEARERDEAEFANYKRKHAHEILSPSHPDTVRVRHIAHKIIHAAHRGLAIKRLHTPPNRHQPCHQDGLQWLDGLNWEVVVLRDDDPNAECFAGAGKIVINTGNLHHFKNDAEIAVTIAHEVGHVIARHSSGIIHWIDLDNMPMAIVMLFILLLFSVIFSYKRRCELEADHIGILLLAAAGIDPIMAVLVRQKKAKIREESALTECLSYISTHPCSKKRWQFLSKPEVMNEALEIYKQDTNYS